MTIIVKNVFLLEADGFLSVNYTDTELQKINKLDLRI